MPTQKVNPQTDEMITRFRGGDILFQFQFHRLMMPMLTLVAAFGAASDGDPGGLTTFGFFAVPVFLVSAFISRPNGSSVEIEGERLRVFNPIRQYEFLISNVTVKDSGYIGRLGATIVIDVNGTWVRCFGLGRRMYSVGRNDLPAFKKAILERGGLVDDRRPVQWYENPAEPPQRQQR